MRLTGSLILSCLIFVAACTGHRKPPDLIKEDTYINLLVELQLIRSYQTSISRDSTVNADSLKQLVFQKYGVTADQFRRSHAYYQQQVTQQKKRLDTAIDRLRMDQVTDSTRQSRGPGQDSLSRQ